MKINPRFLIVPALVAGLHAASAADITGTVTLSGTPPPNPTADTSSAPACSAIHPDPFVLPIYAVGANHELKDVVVYLKGVTGKSTGESAPPLVLDQKGCEYIPYVTAVQTGQKILVRNSDPASVPMHNVDVTPTVEGNKPFNKAQMTGASDIAASFAVPENFIRFKCDVHPWMFSYVTVVDSPYFAVSDKDGSFKISNVPPGKYMVEALHRKAGKVDKEVEVKDADVKLDFTMEVPAAK
jgi:hypothetical protein